MSTKTRIKAKIKTNKVHSSSLTLYYWHNSELNKTYNLALCNQCSRKIIKEKDKYIDKSNYRYYKTLSIKPARIWLSSDILHEIKLPCDFCKGGKKIEDFVK